MTHNPIPPAAGLSRGAYSAHANDVSFSRGRPGAKCRRTFAKVLLGRVALALILLPLLLCGQTASAADRVSFREQLAEGLTYAPGSSVPVVATSGRFDVYGVTAMTGQNVATISADTEFKLSIGSWNFDKKLSDASVLNLKKRMATFAFSATDARGAKVRWLLVRLKWSAQGQLIFSASVQTTEFAPSPIAADFLSDVPGPIAGSTTGGLKFGSFYNPFRLQIEGKTTSKEVKARDKSTQSLRRTTVAALGTWQTWENNSLDLASSAMAGKGICIEDRTAALPPSAHFPMISTDTFPSVWPGTSYPIANVRVFSYSLGAAPARNWVLWAIQNNIKVLVGINLQDYTTDLAAFADDYAKADPYLKSCFDRNILAIAVGNEVGDWEVPNVIAGIDAARALIAAKSLPDVPVSVVLNLNPMWIVNAWPPRDAVFTSAFLQLLPHMDVIMVNTYGAYFDNYDLLTPGLSWTSNGQVFSVLLNQWGSVRVAARKTPLALGKPLWVCETGWSSAPLSNHPEPMGWSSPAHLKTFYRNFLAFDQAAPYLPQETWEFVQPPELIFYFGLRDSYLPLLDVEEYFGLFKASGPLIQKDL